MPSVQKMIKHISKNLQRFLQDFEYVFYDRDCCKATFTTFLPCRFHENVLFHEYFPGKISSFSEQSVFST